MQQHGNWKSEFSMGQFDFERLHDIKARMDDFGYLISNFDRKSVEFLMPYWASLNIFYINIQAVLNETEKEIMDIQMERALRMVNGERKIIGNRIDISANEYLLGIHRELIRLAQFHGLGILVDRVRSETENLRRAAGLIKDRRPGK